MKRATADLLSVYLRDVRKVREDYLPRRRVTVTVCGYPVGRKFDGDNLLKITLDALKLAHLIVDDSSEWLEYPAPRVVYAESKGEEVRTIFLVEDIE